MPGIGTWIGVQRGFGGGDFIKSLSPIFYIKDLTVIQDGYFVDSSGNNKQIQAATTTVANDSLIMPANDAEIISALTSAGCYSQFYTNDATPKKVLLSNISPCYNDYAYYGYIEKRSFFLCSSAQTSNRVNLLNLLNIQIVKYESIQGGVASNVSGVFQCEINKLAYVDYGNWGNQDIQKINATATNYTISSTGYLANKLYKIQLFGAKNNFGLTKIQHINVPSLNNINSADFVGLKLHTLRLHTLGGVHSVKSEHFEAMPLTWIQLVGLNGNNVIKSSDLKSMNLTWFEINFSGTGHIIDSVDFTSMPLSTFCLANAGSNNKVNLSNFANSVQLSTFYLNGNTNSQVTGKIEDLPSVINTQIFITNSGTDIDYLGGALPAWGSVTITIQTALTTAMVDSFLINWAPVAGTGTKTINLAGTNQPHSSSDPNVVAAKTTLQGKGKTLILN